VKVFQKIFQYWMERQRYRKKAISLS